MDPTSINVAPRTMLRLLRSLAVLALAVLAAIVPLVPPHHAGQRLAGDTPAPAFAGVATVVAAADDPFRLE